MCSARFLPALLQVALAAVLAGPAAAGTPGPVGTAPAESGAPAAPTPARQGELLHLLRHECGACHGLTLRGGLGPPLLPGALAHRPPQVLRQTILDGRPGTPMPPWRPVLREEEAAWLVDRLREGIPDGR